MKKYLFLAVAATVFAACSNDSDPVSQAPENGKNNTEAVNVPVTFGAYVDRATTRAGATGVTALDSLKKIAGFGVMAYYTDNNTYDGLTTPNFMYNQKVTWNKTDSVWTYTPVKYWPNEYGSNATSEEIDRVSFFAYGPYVEVTPSNGKATANADWGITGLSRNSATGDPFVKYIASFDETKSVDLVWGVSDGTAWNIVESTTAQTMTAGLPWLDVQRPKDPTKTQNLKFTFKHALTQLNVQIDAMVDSTDVNKGLDANTRIYVRSVTFEGFAMQGALNLNNTTANTPLWLSYDGANDLDSGDEVTIYDGRKDGKEGVAAAGSEKSRGLNAKLIQDTEWGDANQTAGVTETPVNLFTASAANTCFYVIPTSDNVKVTIVYDVETKDVNLNTYLSDGKMHGSSIE
ncbi:MAG: hypothetical protein K6F78_02020, partial [Bacteroidaceae bacterium]|nr:hypothetical protein [Bacteroidaceae bacterium]